MSAGTVLQCPVPARLGVPWGRTPVPRGALTGRAVRRGLDTRVAGSMIACLRRASSTNDVAMWLAGRGAPDGAVVTAESQWAGRGRLGRKWHSPPGSGLWFSVLLRPPCPPGAAQALTFLGAVAAVRAIRGVCGVPAVLKWPNDVVLGGRKLGGVLAEIEAEGAAVRHAVVGIGINVNAAAADFPPALRETATSLRALLGRSVNRSALLRRILAEADRRYLAFVRQGSGPLVAEAAALMPISGAIVRARDHSRVIEGAVAGLDDDGALLVRLMQGTIVRLNAGEVTILR